MKTILPILFACLLFGSCRFVTPKTEVEGEVWNPALNKPVTGIPVALREVPGPLSTRCCAENIQVVYTNSEGKYYFEPIHARISSRYRIDFQNVDDWWYKKDNFYIDKETTNYYKTEAVGRAKFYFGIINDTPSPDDTLWFKANCLSMNWLAIGAHSDPNKYAKKVGDVQNIANDGSPVSAPSGWYFFEWEVWRKGNKTYHQDSVWVENGTVYELHY